MEAKLIHCARTITRKQNKLEGWVMILGVIFPFLNTTLRLKGVNYEGACSLYCCYIDKNLPHLRADVVEFHDPSLNISNLNQGKMKIKSNFVCIFCLVGVENVQFQLILHSSVSNAAPYFLSSFFFI